MAGRALEQRTNQLGWRMVRRGPVWDLIPPVRFRDHVSRLAPLVLALSCVGGLLLVRGMPEHPWTIAIYGLLLVVAAWLSWTLTPIAIRVRADGQWIGTGDFRLRSGGRKVAIGVSQDGPSHFVVFVSFARRGRMVTAWRSTSRSEAIEVASELRVLVGQSPLGSPGGAAAGPIGAEEETGRVAHLQHMNTHARGHVRRPID